jgi:hypothetical protein
MLGAALPQQSITVHAPRRARAWRAPISGTSAVSRLQVQVMACDQTVYDTTSSRFVGLNRNASYCVGSHPMLFR